MGTEEFHRPLRNSGSSGRSITAQQPADRPLTLSFLSTASPWPMHHLLTGIDG